MNKKLSKTRVASNLIMAFKRLRTRCFKCRSYISYKNPMAICWECGNKFCYEHINYLQVNSNMKETEKVRCVCDKCKKEHEYRILE